MIPNNHIQAIQDYLDNGLPEISYIPSWDKVANEQVFRFENAPHHEVRITLEFFRDCPSYVIELPRLGLSERIREAGDQPLTFIVSWQNGCTSLIIPQFA